MEARCQEDNWSSGLLAWALVGIFVHNWFSLGMGVSCNRDCKGRMALGTLQFQSVSRVSGGGTLGGWNRPGPQLGFPSI